MIKVSTSGKKKGAQKHKNTYAFRANKNSKKTNLINSLPINGICKRCKDIIEWRKKFKKYKPLKTPKRCVCCEEKTVKEAYHILCNKCAKDKGVCAKCQGSEDIVQSDVKSDKELLQEQQKLDSILSSLPERKKRTYLRQLERGGEVSLNNQDQETEDDDHLYSGSDEETSDEENS
ncbi:9631_t:CDS:2 [Dentiscutata heterogama]|uniref:9631_t:CDS:1 n=1 Tax=Dentiscutata heterogama TaxID=1316150 RepID=A0ACA9KCN7_9GLOM|nr:9631_t:CDS:2 [Dentiscutata heterogama]